MKSLLRFFPLVLLSILLAGCTATQFHGSPHINGGASGCESKCADQGLEMAGMVFLGEYTDGCICAKPGYHVEALDSAAPAVGGAVGVILQQRREQQAQQQ